MNKEDVKVGNWYLFDKKYFLKCNKILEPSPNKNIKPCIYVQLYIEIDRKASRTFSGLTMSIEGLDREANIQELLYIENKLKTESQNDLILFRLKTEKPELVNTYETFVNALLNGD